MFPAPALAIGYTYTTTGVLREIPTLQNGGVERRSAQGYLDATGQLTTTVTSQPTTTEQLVITFHWNPDLYWADGTPLTAQDSVFAWDEARRSPTTTDVQTLLTSIESYTALDKHTTQAVLRAGQIDPNYPLAAWTPLPRHLLQHATATTREQFMRAPLGYGAFTFANEQPATGIVLQRNPYWHHGGTVDQLRFRFFTKVAELREALLQGKIDIAPLDEPSGELPHLLDQDAAAGKTNLRWIRGPIYEQLDFNLAEPLLQDLRVRRAIAHAIDRPALGNMFFGGKAALPQSWILPDQPEYAGDEQLTRYTYNPARARTLLQEAGFVDADGDGIREGPDGKPFSFTILTTDTALRTALVERIVRGLRAVGLPAQVKVVPLDQLYAPSGPLFRRQFQMAAFAWLNGVYPAGLPLWSCSAIPNADNNYTGDNFAGWCFMPAEAALHTATNTLDARERAAAYLRHQQFWTQECPAIPLLQRPLAIVWQTDMRGIKPDALAPVTWNVTAWRR